MKITLISILMCCAIIFAGQCNNGIIQISAYWQVNYPGNIPVGVPGVHVGPDTSYTVYLKMTKNVEPEWITAKIGNKQFSVLKMKLKSPVQVGTLVGQKEPIIFSSSDIEQWWQLTLEKMDNNPVMYKSDNEIILNGSWQNKTISYTIKPIQQLEPVLAM